jgi:ANTAR domain
VANADNTAEERVAEALITGVRDAPVEGLPARLCEMCVQLLPVTGASISLRGRDSIGATLYATDPVAARLAEAQVTLGTGPCTSAWDSGAPALAPDLAAGNQLLRWPMFCAAAAELGVRAAFSFPLSVGASSAGTLDLYRDAPGSLSPAQVRMGLLAADTAVLAVLRLSDRGGAQEDEGGLVWLGPVESGHEQVHQATGMVMMMLEVGPEEALLRLRARAFTTGTSLSALARRVVERRTWEGEDD